MNVFIDDWKALGTGLEAGDWSGQVSDSLVLHQAFTDQKYSKDKKISCLNWHPTISGKVQHVKVIELFIYVFPPKRTKKSLFGANMHL